MKLANPLKNRKLLVRTLLVVLYIGLALLMAVTGKRHTILIDNKDAEDGSYIGVNGMSVTCLINHDLIESSEFKALIKIYDELKDFAPPFEVLSDGETVLIENETRLVDFLHDKGKKGVSIQRYKGLGEMNPEQLWSTTMDPAHRSLLLVNVENAMEADQVFSTLMGDKVEPRREFIEKNARYVRRLDV